MVKIDGSRCDVCGTCIAVCPANALMIEFKLSADAAACVSCGRCVKVCPFGALELDVDSRKLSDTHAPESPDVAGK
jgi:ferredoxin